MMSRMFLPVVLTAVFSAAAVSAADPETSLLPAGTALPASAEPAAPDPSLVPAGTALPASPAPAAEKPASPAQSEAEKKAPPKQIPFRGVFGTIHAAELSFAKPAFADEDPDEVDCSPYGKDTAWGQLIVTVVMGRSISRFDFVLEWNGKTYPCLAIAVGDNAYSMNTDAWTITARNRNPKVPIRMLFPLPKSISGSENFAPGTLSDEMNLMRQNLPDQSGKSFRSTLPPDVIRFRVLPDNAPFLTAKEVQKTGGFYGFTYDEMVEVQAGSAASLAPAKK